MKKTSIGGSALLEGIMMIGPYKKAIAVRKPDGEMDLCVEDLPKKNKISKIPIFRGAYNLIYQMIISIKALTYAASFYDLEEEPKKEPEGEAVPKDDTIKKDKKNAETLGKGTIFFSLLLSLVVTVGLFILLPNFLIGLLGIKSNILNNLLEGVVRILIFTLYLKLCSLMKDIKRVWMYHGAEHKTISCYEAADELTVANVRKYSTKHRRCGTSFMFLVLIVSIIVFSFVGWYSPLVNILFRIALIPLVAGIAYEIIRITGKHDNIVSRIVSAPGMWFQRLTTAEPDDGMIECAIAAFTAVLPENENDSKW
ncbi:MAG: DUF1385 domain-containing protein [Clostridia bacterium]|jgi:uncharacterized protein YqhQ